MESLPAQHRFSPTPAVLAITLPAAHVLSACTRATPSQTPDRVVEDSVPISSESATATGTPDVSDVSLQQADADPSAPLPSSASVEKTASEEVSGFGIAGVSWAAPVDAEEQVQVVYRTFSDQSWSSWQEADVEAASDVSDGARAGTTTPVSSAASAPLKTVAAGSLTAQSTVALQNP